jgi:hypothetical protein
VSLLVAVVCLAIAVAVFFVVPPPVNTSHTSHDVVPGSVALPPTAVPPTASATATLAR